MAVPPPRGPELDPRPVTSYPCLDSSPFCVSLKSFKYPQNEALMEREKGRMSEPYLKSSYQREIWLLSLFFSSRPDSRSEMFEKLLAHFFFHRHLIRGLSLEPR